MSLDYELGQIENYKEVCYTGEPGERKMSPVTHALIFITMSVDIGRITEKNYLEFYTRAKFAAALFGSSLMKADEHGGYKERGITIEDVRAHIGLHTHNEPHYLADRLPSLARRLRRVLPAVGHHAMIHPRPDPLRQTFGREQSRGWGRNPKRTLYREWTRWTYSEYHRAWVHDGKTWHPLRATRKQILAGRDGA
jgi:hypothetical protein